MARYVGIAAATCVWASASVASAQAMSESESESERFASATGESARAEASADCSSPRARDERRCFTVREGTVSGGYVGLDVGLLTLTDATEQRVGAGAGPAAQLRLGLELWDRLVAGVGLGFAQLADHAPISDQAVDCDVTAGIVTSCDDAPHTGKSVVRALFFSLEAGVQERFRPSSRVSLAPGISLGQNLGLGSIKRVVECDGCRTQRLDGSGRGTYVVPFFRVTLDRVGYMAATLRSAWFLGGDLQQLTTLGFECGLP